MGCCSSCCADESGKHSPRLSRRREVRRTNSKTSVSGSQLDVSTSTDGVSVSPPNGTQEQVLAEMSPIVDLITEQDSRQLVQIAYEPASISNGHQCAYCDDPKGDYYDYFCVPYDMPLSLLEEFMEHGWWRTGKVVFRPRFDIVCCPGYATRVPVAKYTFTKKHRKVIRKWGEFLKEGNARWENRGAVENIVSDTGVGAAATDDNHDRVTNKNIEVENRSMQSQNKNKKRAKKHVTPGKGADASKPPCKKAKDKRAERKRNKEAQSSYHPTATNTCQPMPDEISLSNFIAAHTPQLVPGQKHIFETKLLSCNPRDSLLTATLPRAYELFDKLQRTVHPTKVRFNSQNEFEQGFYLSPLQNSSTTDKPHGSYHLQYYIDGELVMFSVVDILPHYFISIYFVYDPDLRFMTPGVFTCLYEMNYVQNLQQVLPNLKYYCLGYYNHFDDKASYKRQFKPQEVLCNETDTFVSLESAIPKFQEKKYSRLVDESVPEKEGRRAPIDMLAVSKRYNPLNRFCNLSSREKNSYRESLKLFVAEAGSAAAHRCCIDLVSNFAQ